ncbi:MAG: beta-lactamase family protein [Gemmatimonadales bacterium]|nr:beta-lactamase family protein [Gemmatimonadales bacterium]
MSRPIGRLACVGVLAASLLAGCAGGPPPSRPLPRSAPLEARLAPAAAVLDSAIAAGAAPGAVLAVSVRGERFTYGVGRLGLDDPTRPDAATLYDMASLTKVIALTTLAMMAVDEGKLVLDVPVVSYLPDFGRGLGPKGSVTVRDLLLHDSGLPAHRRLWEETFVREGAILRTVTSDLERAPGERMVYSDLGAITLMAILEQVYETRIDRLFRDRIAEPLGLTRTRFLPPGSWRRFVAPTENDPWRGHVLRGEVHDENASRLGGVSGHAGLFSTADDLLRFTEWALAGALGRQVAGDPPPPSGFATWTVTQDHPHGSSRGLGWDTPSGRSSAGRIMSARSFGHTGFTGTSIWIDPTRETIIILLTNRVHPTRNTPNFSLVRAVVADAVMRALFPDAPPRETPDGVTG